MHEYADGLAALATNATAGDVHYSEVYEELCDTWTLDGVQRIFERVGVRWGRLVSEDARRVLSGQPLRFFRDHSEYVSSYRAARGIALIEARDHGFVHASEIGKRVRANLDRMRNQHQQFGVTTAMLEDGYACMHEARYFYQQQEWKDRAAVCRYHAGYKCERCGMRNVELHAHHRTPIISAWHYNFDLNFAWWKLEALCEKCHRAEHDRTVRGGYGFVPASADGVRAEKQELRALHQLHDELKMCPYCHGGGAQYRTVLAQDFA